MTAFTRSDNSVLGRWWMTVDHWTLGAITVLIGFGIVMVLAASPAVADRLGVDSYYFVRRQFAFLAVAIALLLGVSLLSPRGVRRLAIAVFVVALAMTAVTLFLGVEIKGSRRWLAFAGLSVQPSEFIKPAFAIVAAWLFASQRDDRDLPGNVVSILLYLAVVGVLILQPDFGMAVVVSAVWFAQFFVAGLPLLWVAGLSMAGLGAVVCAYMFLPHVASRIDRFIDPASGDSFQITRSLEAFSNGGLLGRGPGEGTVKQILPDAHADFVFAVAGEELGVLACLVIVTAFGFIVLRGFSRLFRENNLFVVLAVTGLLVQFGLQALVNMASALDLMPTKGMTLPFISYGGSSLIAVALGIGMVLALTRRRAGREVV